MAKVFVNKWNGRIYTLVRYEGELVTLTRDDGSEFTISRNELKFSYKEVE